MRRALLIGLGLAVLTACAQPAAQAPATGQTVALQGHGYDCRIASVVDGDTVKIACADGSQTSARLMGFDTPETYRSGCDREYALGKRATSYLRTQIAAAERIALTGKGRDKYDRLLVRLYLDGRDVAAMMIGQGLAVPYDGDKRINWCARLA